MPAKADVEAQATFTPQALAPRVAQAHAGQRRVGFMDAAHFVFAPFLGVGGWFTRVVVQAPSGRQRVHGLAALEALPDLFPVPHLTSLTSGTVGEVWRLLACAHPGRPLTVVLENARSHRCPLVQTLARSLGIEVRFLPPYSPNLNLSDRFWQFVKKPCLYSTYYAHYLAFEQAIRTCLAQAPTRHRAALASLLTLKFHTCKTVPVLGEESNVHLFPVAQKTLPQVSSQAP
jgi:transposase